MTWNPTPLRDETYAAIRSASQLVVGAALIGGAVVGVNGLGWAAGLLGVLLLDQGLDIRQRVRDLRRDETV